MAHPLVNEGQMWPRRKEAAPVPRPAETETELRSTLRQLRWNCETLERRAEFAETALQRWRWMCFLVGVLAGAGLLAVALWAMAAVVSTGVIQ